MSKKAVPYSRCNCLFDGVAFPVRAGHAQQLERLDPAGVGNVRTAAQIDEFPLPVEAEGRMVGQSGLDVLDLQLLMQPLHQLQAPRRAAG